MIIHFPRNLRVVLLVLAALLLACTCSAPAAFNQPAPPPRLQTPVPVSAAAADSFIRKWQQAATQGQTFNVTFTESELTSIVARELRQAGESGQDVWLTDPQIHLTDGLMWLSGQVALSDSQQVQAQAALALEVREGRLTASLRRLTLGALPVPQTLIDRFNRQLAEQLDKINRQTPNVTLTRIALREGELQVTGALK